jgi:hypothetical protein
MEIDLLVEVGNPYLPRMRSDWIYPDKLSIFLVRADGSADPFSPDGIVELVQRPLFPFDEARRDAGVAMDITPVL